MNNTLNILSLDWDYFIDATNHQRWNLFPDGNNENLSRIFSMMIWGCRYHNPDLSKITVDIDAVNKVRKLFDILAERNSVEAMITDSHKHCYDFVKRLCNIKQCKNINLVNVDFHHDLYSSDMSEVHCGNWLAYLMNDYPNGEYIWVKRSDSDECAESEDSQHSIIQIADLDIIFEFDWDAIFLCRSDVWSPPHLDQYFIDLGNILNRYFNTSFEPAAMSSRYDDVKSIIDYISKDINGIRKLYNQSLII